MFAMAFDNFMWIPADRKWFHTNEWKPHFYVYLTLPFGARREFLFPKTSEGWAIVRGRVKDVFTHLYDIVPAVLTSLLLAITVVII